MTPIRLVRGGVDKPVKTRRQRGGEDAQKAGKAFELLIDKELDDEHKARRISWHDRHQPLYRPLGGGRYAPVAKGKADHGGMFVGGLAFAIEDKSSESGSLGRSAMRAGEITHLDATARDGGLALLAIELRPPRGPVARFVVPWDRVPWKRSGKGAGVSMAALVGWEMPEQGFLRRFVTWCPACHAYRLRWWRAGACCMRHIEVHR